MAEVFLNDQFIDEEALRFSSSNRSFRYGDGLFETIKVAGGKILFYPQHYSRFILGMNSLQLNIPDDWSLKYLQAAIERVIDANGLTHARVRMMAFRNGEGIYLPQTNDASLMIQAFPLEDSYYRLNDKGLLLGLYTDAVKARLPLSNVKTNNALPYIMASVFAKKSNFDDCLLLNDRGGIADATSSNLFIIKSGRIISPPDSEGGVSGVMRRVLIKLMRKEGMAVEEAPLTVQEVKEAEECFLTNVIQGIRWVAAFGDARFKNDRTSMLVHKLNEKVLQIIQ